MTMNSNSPRYSRLVICSTMAKKSQRAKFSLVKAIIPTPAEPADRKWIQIPAAIIPTPFRWPVLVFPGLSLGLGRIPRYFGGRKKPDAKKVPGTPGPRPGDRPSGGRPDDREAGHVFAKSLQCKSWELTDSRPAPGSSR